jgi:predicted GNAT family acetyltransferase
VSIQVTKNEAAGQYELSLDGERVGVADYYERGDVIVLPHTETMPAFRGRGFAGQLVGFALDDIRAAGKKVRPVCPFVADYIWHNPQYADLVA